MQQSVNLLDSLNTLDKQSISIKHFSLVILVFVAILASTTIYRAFSIASLTHDLTQLQMAKDNAAKELLTLQQRVAGYTKGKPMHKEISSLASTVAAKKQLIGHLSNPALQNSEGFSKLFSLFAEQINRGVWLTNIDIDKGGTSITLKGKALRINLIPSTLKRLTRFTNLNHKPLQLIKIKQNKKSTKAPIEFILANNVENKS